MKMLFIVLTEMFHQEQHLDPKTRFFCNNSCFKYAYGMLSTQQGRKCFKTEEMMS